MNLPPITRRRTVIAETMIQASPRAIWDVLVDLEHYPEWNPFTHHVESSLVVGDSVHLQVRMGEGREMLIHDRILAVEPEQYIVWVTRHPRWLLYGERAQTLTVMGEHTRYRTWETFSGLLTLPTMTQADAVRAGFVAVCNSLKAYVEAQQRSR